MRKLLLLLFLALLIRLPSVMAQVITQAEYFWDADPGPGNGTAMNAEDGNFNETLEQAVKTIVSFPATGTHTFSVRVRDANNNWGPAFSTIIKVESPGTTVRPIQILQAEYFWDVDPGSGNGTVLLALDGNFDEALESLFKSTSAFPGTGLHKLGVRVKSADNGWGPVFYGIIRMDSTTSTVRPIRVKAAEYFWDTDPGAGNGTTLLAYDGNFNAALETVFKSTATFPGIGIHKLGVRVKSADNSWGPVFYGILRIDSATSTVRPVKIMAAEYFFDVDPGNGNATPMIAFDGNFNAALEALQGASIPSPVTAGVHTLYIRAKDADYQWGPAFGLVVNIDTTIASFNASISGLLQVCDNAITGQPYTVSLVSGNTYSWTIAGGVITSGQNTNSVTVNWNTGGNHSLQVIECDAAGIVCDTDMVFIQVNPTYQLNQAYAICDGDSAFIGGTWQTVPGTYTENHTTSAGCDSIIISTLAVHPNYSVTDSVSLNAGDSVFVGGAWQTTGGTYFDLYLSSAGCDSLVTTILTIVPVGFPDLVSPMEIRLLPNPADDFLIISGAGQYPEEKLTISIYDLSGRLMLNTRFAKKETNRIDIAALAPGCYFIRIRTGQQQVIHKFVKSGF